MNIVRKFGKLGLQFGVPILLAGLAVARASAQEPPPEGEGFPPPPGGQGQFGGPGGGPPGQRGGPMKLTPAIVPATALTAYLDLSPEKIQNLTDVIEALRVARPRPGGNRQSGQGGTVSVSMPSREEMESARSQFEAAIARANRNIAALLDEHQTKRLATVMKAFKALQSDRISLNAAARLRLTDKQIESLAALGDSPTQADVTKSFTAEQIEVADLNRTQARRGPPGRRPGFGPPGGGPGFGPPPDGGPIDGGPP